MSFIAIDLGASFIKGALLDLDAFCLTHIQRVPFPGFISDKPPLQREVDPRQVMEAVRSIIDRLLLHGPCSGIVMCGQMHGFVLASERGEPLANFISWQDQRALTPHRSGAGTCFQVMAQRIEPAERQRLGNELRPGLPVSVLFQLVQNDHLPEANAIPTALADFVVANLCGSPPATEATNAAAQGAFNHLSFDWDWAILAKLGLDRLRWPTLRTLGQVVGWLKVGSLEIPCYTPIGDQQCALLGALLEERELSVNIATGSQVSLISPQAEFGDYQTRPFFDGRFLKTITHIPAGRSLNALIRLLSELAQGQQVELADPWPYIESNARSVGETDLRVNLAFFVSALGDRGEISNVREENLTVGHLFRAAFKNMADNYHTCALRLSPDQAWRNLVFSGGIAHKTELLRQMICQKFHAPSRLCASQEDTLFGLFALALVFERRASSAAQAIAMLGERPGLHYS